MRDEDTKHMFNKFNYYFNDNDPHDQFNSKEKKFQNPHINLKATSAKPSYTNINKEKIERKSYYSNNQNQISQNSNQNQITQKKFSKLKLNSTRNYNSTNTLNKHYRHVSSNNSTSNSTNVSNSNQINQKAKRTNSLLNFKY